MSVPELFQVYRLVKEGKSRHTGRAARKLRLWRYIALATSASEAIRIVTDAEGRTLPGETKVLWHAEPYGEAYVSSGLVFIEETQIPLAMRDAWQAAEVA